MVKHYNTCTYKNLYTMNKQITKYAHIYIYIYIYNIYRGYRHIKAHNSTLVSNVVLHKIGDTPPCSGVSVMWGSWDLAHRLTQPAYSVAVDYATAMAWHMCDMAAGGSHLHYSTLHLQTQATTMRRHSIRLSSW